MLRYEIKEFKEYSMIAEVFVKNGINFLYGASGLGKTVSTIKALNADGITPILIDLDDNIDPKILGIDCTVVDGDKVLNSLVFQINCSDEEYDLIKEPIVIPSGSVLIIDTYAMLEKYFDKAPELLNAMVAKGCTVVVIGHTVDIATKKDIPDAPSKFVNHCSSKLFLQLEKVDRKDAVVLNVVKLRGYTGSKKIVNWMR